MKGKRNMPDIRERMFKLFFIASDRYRQFAGWTVGLCRFVINVAYVLFIAGFIFYAGFGNTPEILSGLKSAFRILFIVIFFTKYIPGLLDLRAVKLLSKLPGAIIFLFSLGVFLSNTGAVSFGKPLNILLNGNIPVIAAIFLIGVTEMPGLMRTISSVKIPPGLIFSASFLIIIFIGSGLLMMPKAHHGNLTYLDSLFTSVSAVCVTGLIVVDTSTVFTTLGKSILLCLIQTGGLGIMTFTGFFGYVFTSSSSFRDRLLLKELFSVESMNNLLKLLAKIIMFTFLLEGIGAAIIYGSLGDDIPDKLLFSVFHSVSAFCNAGFSTLSMNLGAQEIVINYTLQITVAVLIILGGIGFPVLLGLYSNIKHLAAVITRRIQGRINPIKPEHRDVPARIAVSMTIILIITGAVFYYLLESPASMVDMDNSRKIMVSLFGSISARTAGFNITDISVWGYPTIFLMIFLMWIGASPGSTGGGIKTTTFALAFRTAWNYLRGRDTLIIGNREISNKTVSRVLTIIFLSLSVITTGFAIMLLSEPGKDPVKLFFECFSAFGTVGLSLADTTTFTDTGKIVDIFLMFIGRVGPLTLLTGMLASSKVRYAGYPGIDIVIN